MLFCDFLSFVIKLFFKWVCSYPLGASYGKLHWFQFSARFNMAFASTVCVASVSVGFLSAERAAF